MLRLTESFKQQTMTIGSQIRVLEVMQREEGNFEVLWREEWTCADRLLSKVQECPDRDMVRASKRHSKRHSKTQREAFRWPFGALPGF